jgi:hypothetical protein
MKVGTLSFEIRGESQNKEMVLSPEERREIIARVASAQTPDLLVCAGYSLGDRDDLEWLVQDRRISSGKAGLIVEVQHDKAVPTVPATTKQPRSGAGHVVYLLIPGKPAQSLGSQAIVSGADRNSALLMKQFEEMVPINRPI